MPQSRADAPPGRGREEGKRRVTPRDAGQSRREENEKDSVVACRGMGILPMIPGSASSGSHPRDGCCFGPEGHSPTRRPASGGMLMLSHWFCTEIRPHPLETKALTPGAPFERLRLPYLAPADSFIKQSVEDGWSELIKAPAQAMF